MGKKYSVLFLRSNPVDPDPRVEKEATALSNAGFNVSILGWDRFGNSKPLEKKENVLIRRLSIQAVYGFGIKNLPALLRWQWGVLVWLINHGQEYDILHACDFDTVIPALFMRLIWGKKVVYDIYDFYADHLRSTPEWIKRIISWLDKNCIDWVDGIILADDSRRDQITGSNPKRIAVVYNSPQDNLQDLIKCNVPNQQYFSLAYVGLLQIERGILEVLDVLKKHPDWNLDLAGFGGDENEILEQVDVMPNVKWHGKISYHQALEISSNVDIIFATYDPIIPNHRYASPNKVFEAMMLGKPIIVARDTNMDRIIEKFECGLVVDYGDVEALDLALTALYSDLELRSRLGRNGRQAYEDVYNWSFMESKLLDLYASLPTPIYS